jgi:hypothetical protein
MLKTWKKENPIATSPQRNYGAGFNYVKPLTQLVVIDDVEAEYANCTSSD